MDTDSSQKPWIIYNRTHGWKVNLGSLRSEDFPTEKAGICSRFKFQRKSYPAMWLAHEWCHFEYEGDHICWDFGDEMFDFNVEGGSLSPEIAEQLRSEMSAFEDKTDEIVKQMVWAESIATPEDFTEVEVDNGGLVGYADSLRRIWRHHHPNSDD